MTERTRNQNNRAMRVNVQVCSVITICETVGNLINWVIWAIWARILGGSHGGTVMLTQAMILNFIFLPYTFLMNTRYNKNRIVEGGWKNVLRNVMLSKCYNSRPDAQRKNNSNKEKCFAFDSTKKYLRRLSIITKSSKMNTIEPSVYVIKYSRNIPENVSISRTERVATIERTEIVSDSESLLDVPLNDIPCTSKGETESNTVENSVTGDLTSKQLNDFKNSRSKILFDLSTNINDEKKYILNFMRLLTFEDKNTNGENPEDLQHTPQDNIPVELMPHFVGSVERKLTMRMELLEILTSNKNENSIYSVLLEDFINMEENLFNEGC